MGPRESAPSQPRGKQNQDNIKTTSRRILRGSIVARAPGPPLRSDYSARASRMSPPGRQNEPAYFKLSA